MRKSFTYPDAKKSKEWKAGIRGVLYRDIAKTFKKIDDGLFSLLNFQEEEYIKNDILARSHHHTFQNLITKVKVLLMGTKL